MAERVRGQPHRTVRSATLHRYAVLIVAAALAFAAPARAADPIMPLSEVRPGMHCTGLSVVHGTEISSFDVEILDVIADDPFYGGSRLLIRVSGPAVDATGVGAGFSGSPIYCDGRNAGAISESIGEYGNKVVLATPIEAILTAKPSTAAPSGAAGLAGPLTVSGLSPHTRQLLSKAAARQGRTVLAAPPGPVGGYPPQPLVPGAAVGAALSTGDISIGAVGTVAYRDGDQLYAFGHALDGAGRRALFLQDAYVFGVIGNPVAIPEVGATTYKLTSSGGHALGTFSTDTFSAVAGTLGSPPPAFPLRVTARLEGTDRSLTLESQLADERSLGFGSSISLIAPAAASSAIDRLLETIEDVQLTVCTRFRVTELRKPIRVCNAHFDSFSALTDIAAAATEIDAFDLAPLHIRGAAVGITMRRGVADDAILGATAPRRVRRGETITVRVKVRRRGVFTNRTLPVEVKVPASIRPGDRTLTLSGNGFADSEEEELIELFGDLLIAGEPDQGREPRTVKDLASSVAALHRRLGIEARWRNRAPKVVFASDSVRYDGRARIRLRVVR
jgi:hypothetical protein